MRTKAFLIFFIFFASASAQENGFFAGLSLGTSRLYFDIIRDALSSQTTETEDEEGNTTSTTTYANERTINRFGTSSRQYFGVIAGFRSFLNPTFAVRGYGEYEYHPTTIKNSVDGDRNSKFYNFTLGADAMYYVLRDSLLGISAFAGGGAVYSRYDSYLVSAAGEGFGKLSKFGFMANVGVHFDIATQHGIDIGARYFANETTKKASDLVDDVRVETDVKIRQKPAFFVRYMFQF